MQGKLEKDLGLLSAVESGDVVSQLTLSRRVGVAVGLVNKILKRAVHKGYVKIRSAPAKRYAYYLTPKGFAEKSRLVAEYVETSLDFFRQAKAQYSHIFQRAQNVGFSRLALFGRGELLEIAVLVAMEHEVTLVGIVDPSALEAQKLGLTVVAELDALDEFDAVILADTLDAQTHYNELVATLGVDRVFTPELLRISTLGTPDPDANDEEHQQ